MKGEVIKINGRDLDVMKILWSAEEPLGATQVGEIGELSINTVQAVLKALLQRKYISIADVAYSGTVLTRRYLSAIDINDYIKDTLLNFQGFGANLTKYEALLGAETNKETLIQVGELLQKRRQELSK